MPIVDKIQVTLMPDEDSPEIYTIEVRSTILGREMLMKRFARCRDDFESNFEYWMRQITREIMSADIFGKNG